MSGISDTAIDYFAPVKNYYWRWTERGEVIEWQNGVTICYREELLYLLRSLANDDMPRLGTILLMLAACKDDWRRSTGGLGILQGIKMLVDSTKMCLHTGKEEVAPVIQQAGRFLDVVNELPKEYRTGTKRVLLLQGIAQTIAAGKKIPAVQARQLINEFASGRLDELLQDHSRLLTREYFDADLNPLAEALKIFPDKELLELKIKTGVEQVPLPVEEIGIEEKRPADLLDELEDDTRTSGIARLARHLIAALNIPMHTHGSSDQSYGGVSDITNRGDFDRLLLSELAYDDHTLMARLANNEALYLRREELPSNLEQHRKILVDTTLKMWGIPRVFAISAALACARNNKVRAAINSYSLSGEEFSLSDLSTRKGIIDMMEQLDPSLNCGKGLTSFMNSDTATGLTEYFLITSEESLHDIAFQASLSELKQPLTYLISVSRSGQLEFYEYAGKKRKLLSTAKFDLDELLFSAGKRIPKIKLKDAPAFLSYDPAPLYFPSSKVKFSGQSIYHNQDGTIAITLDHRVLYWSSKNLGAKEVMPFIDHGYYCLGFEKENTNAFYILAIHDQTAMIRLFRIGAKNLNVTVFNLTGKIKDPSWLAFDGNFIVQTRNDGNFFVIDPVTATIIAEERKEKLQEKFLSARRSTLHASLKNVKKITNNGYTTINSTDAILADRKQGIALNNRYISLFGYNNKKFIRIEYKTRTGNVIFASRKNTVTFDWMNNKGIRFLQYAWSDGSEAWVDSRGLIHLRSSDKTLPEITIVNIIGSVNTACWASDGTVSGSPYFTGVDEKSSMPEEEFYSKYIQRFIDTLK